MTATIKVSTKDTTDINLNLENNELTVTLGNSSSTASLQPIVDDVFTFESLSYQVSSTDDPNVFRTGVNMRYSKSDVIFQGLVDATVRGQVTVTNPYFKVNGNALEFHGTVVTQDIDLSDVDSFFKSGRIGLYTNIDGMMYLTPSDANTEVSLDVNTGKLIISKESQTAVNYLKSNLSAKGSFSFERLRNISFPQYPYRTSEGHIYITSVTSEDIKKTYTAEELGITL